MRESDVHPVTSALEPYMIANAHLSSAVVSKKLFSDLAAHAALASKLPHDLLSPRLADAITKSIRVDIPWDTLMPDVQQMVGAFHNNQFINEALKTHDLMWSSFHPLSRPLSDTVFSRFKVDDVLRAYSARILDLGGVIPEVSVPRLDEALFHSAVAWRSVISGLDATVSKVDLKRSVFAGQTTLATTTAAAYVCTTDELTELESGTNLALPGTDTWLRQRLSDLDARLEPLYDGARNALSDRGPHSQSQAAHSLTELLTHTLRLVAPTDAVLAWHRESGRSEDHLHEGRPTRRLRLLYALRNRDGHSKAGELYLATVRKLPDALNQAKHEFESADSPMILESLFRTLEGFLGFLLADEEPW